MNKRTIYDFCHAMSDKVFLSVVSGLYYSVSDAILYGPKPNPVYIIKDTVRAEIIYSREEYGRYQA